MPSPSRSNCPRRVDDDDDDNDDDDDDDVDDDDDSNAEVSPLFRERKMCKRRGGNISYVPQTHAQPILIQTQARALIPSI